MSKHILFFDSGVGGLSVLEETRRLNPYYCYSYLFDNHCFPYGELSEAALLKRVATLLDAAAARLAPNLVVIACNTASTIVLPVLRRHLSVPVVGVVPAIKPAAKLSANRHIGLLATPGTVKRTYTEALINEFAADCRIEFLGSTRLVELAEMKLAGESLDYRREVTEIVKPWSTLSSLDCVVLGCTHFPLLKEEVTQALGGRVSCVDSGEAIARRVASLLPDASSSAVSPILHAYATKAVDQRLVERGLAKYGFNHIQLFN
ncbi:glutamate racemase [Aliagarivorans taiwanensis]|uniref:glutamate racemase n=1 Tax=Aliagarivorans taiwanensis TaxID=561966 RepID=UPI00041EA428|nr:glutamate racemase [Aliagarivorans taiwanensis]